MLRNCFWQTVGSICIVFAIVLQTERWVGTRVGRQMSLHLINENKQQNSNSKFEFKSKCKIQIVCDDVIFISSALHCRRTGNSAGRCLLGFMEIFRIIILTIHMNCLLTLISRKLSI